MEGEGKVRAAADRRADSKAACAEDERVAAADGRADSKAACAEGARAAAADGRAAPALQRIVTNFVQHFAGGQHVLGAHAGCGLGLMCVAKDGFGNHYFAHNVFLLAFKRETDPATGAPPKGGCTGDIVV